MSLFNTNQKMNKFLLLIIISISQLFADLIHPPDGSELNYIHVMFQWNTVEGSTEYNFQLSSTNDFTSPLVSTNTTDLFYIEKDAIGWESQYFWRVRAINGDWMSEYTFHTNNQSYIFTDVDPVDIITNNSSALEGITIYGVMSPFYSAAIDMNGNEVWNSGGVDTYMFSSVDNNYNFLGDANFGDSNTAISSLLHIFALGPLNLAINNFPYYTLRRFGGLQPLCGMGVTSLIDVIPNPTV